MKIAHKRDICAIVHCVCSRGLSYAPPRKGSNMSQVCEICGKHPSAGHNISHSHRVTNRKFKPNIQRVYVVDKNGTRRKMNVCTSCLKAMKVQRS